MASRPSTTDHLQKKPLERRVRVYLDDEPIFALEEARAELAAVEADARQVYEQRFARVRSAAATAAELVDIDRGLMAEMEQACEPARKAVADAEAAVLEASRVYTLRSPHIERDGKPLRGRRAFEQLIAEHPPSDDDHDDARKAIGRPEALARWHADTFTPALIAACCADPALTVEQATEMYEEWTDGEISEIFAAAIAVSQGTRQVDLGKASRAASTPG